MRRNSRSLNERYVSINCGYILFTEKSLNKKFDTIEDITLKDIYVEDGCVLNNDDITFDIYGNHIDTIIRHQYYHRYGYLYKLNDTMLTICILYKNQVRVLNNEYYGLIIDVKNYKKDIIKLTSYLNEFFIRLDIVNHKVCSNINDIDVKGSEIINV